MESPSPAPEAPLEHFELIEDVIAHIRTKLPADSGPKSWKNVCEDVLHCQLPVVEPLLLQELEAYKGDIEQQDKIRGLLRAVSWYKHPPKTAKELLAEINHLRATHPSADDHARLDQIQAALEQQLEGDKALPAAEAIDQLFIHGQREAQAEMLRQIRDQIYYQLLYPHWFEVVKRWAATQTT